MAFTSGKSPKPQDRQGSWREPARRGHGRPTTGHAPVGNAVLTAVGLACVCVVVLCAVAAKSDADDPSRARVATYTTGFGEGRHTVGEEIEPGTYVSEGVKADGSGPCSVTIERAGGGASQVRAVDRGERVVLTLDRDDGAVTVRGCQDFARREPAR